MTRRSAIITLSGFATVAAGIYLGSVLVDRHLKSQVVAAVRKATGREFKVNGAVELRLLPSPQLSISDARLFDLPGFSRKEFAQADRIELDLEGAPLLRGKLQFNEIRFQRLRAELRRNAAGANNWDDLFPKPRGALAAMNDAAFDDARLRKLQRFSMDESEIGFEDEGSSRKWQLSGVSVDTERRTRAGAIPFVLSATLASEVPRLYGTLTLDGRAVLDLAHGRYAIQKTSLEFNGRGLVDTVWARVRGDVAVNRATGTLEGEFDGRALGMGVRAQLTMQGIPDHVRYDGRLALDAFSPRDLLAQFGRQVPGTRDPSALTHASVRMRVHGDKARMIIAPVDATLDASKLTGYITLAGYRRPTIDFRLTVNRINLERYRAVDTPSTVRKEAVPAAYDTVLSSLANEGLRDLGYTVTGEVNVGVMLQAEARNDDVRTLVFTGIRP